LKKKYSKWFLKKQLHADNTKRFASSLGSKVCTKSDQVMLHGHLLKPFSA